MSAEETSFLDWLQFGMEQGWCGPAVCGTHDGVPMTEWEETDCMDGGDPCMHILRLYEDDAMKEAVEKYHLPSQWRKPKF